MIDAVSNISASAGTSQRQASPAFTPPSAPVKAVVEQPQLSSNGMARIRIDNDLDLAIIEYRSSDTGDVLRQYPTEAQIQAFSRASELDARSEAQAAETPDVAPTGEAAVADVPDIPAPETSAAAAPASAVSVTAGGESVPTYTAATQSVTV